MCYMSQEGSAHFCPPFSGVFCLMKIMHIYSHYLTPWILWKIGHHGICRFIALRLSYHFGVYSASAALCAYESKGKLTSSKGFPFVSFSWENVFPIYPFLCVGLFIYTQKKNVGRNKKEIKTLSLSTIMAVLYIVRKIKCWFLHTWVIHIY